MTLRPYRNASDIILGISRAFLKTVIAAVLEEFLLIRREVPFFLNAKQSWHANTIQINQCLMKSAP
jgi:hypothetical protein